MLLKQLDTTNFSNLDAIGPQALDWIKSAPLPAAVTAQIRRSFHELRANEGAYISRAVRSRSPLGEFCRAAGEIFEYRGGGALVKTVHRCYASLFTNRAIKYRENQGFGNAEVAISMGVQKNGALRFVGLLGGLHPRPRHGFQQGGRLSTAFTASAKTLHRADSRPMIGWLSKYYFQNNERRRLPCLTLSVSLFLFSACKHKTRAETESEHNAQTAAPTVQRLLQPPFAKIPVQKEMAVRDFFQFLDKTVLKNGTLSHFKLSENLLLRANPWILDRLLNTDYYFQLSLGNFYIQPIRYDGAKTGRHAPDSAAKKVKFTKRDDRQTTRMPQIPWLEPNDQRAAIFIASGGQENGAAHCSSRFLVPKKDGDLCL